jgi:hypothetical protein
VSTTPTGGPEPKYISWNQVEREHLNPLIDREMVHGQQIMLARVFIKKGVTSRCITTSTNRSLTFSKVLLKIRHQQQDRRQPGCWASANMPHARGLKDIRLRRLHPASRRSRTRPTNTSATAANVSTTQSLSAGHSP